MSTCISYRKDKLVSGSILCLLHISVRYIIYPFINRVMLASTLLRSTIWLNLSMIYVRTSFTVLVLILPYRSCLPSTWKGYDRAKLSTENRLMTSEWVPEIIESEMTFLCTNKLFIDLVMFGTFEPYLPVIWYLLKKNEITIYCNLCGDTEQFSSKPKCS